MTVTVFVGGLESSVCTGLLVVNTVVEITVVAPIEVVVNVAVIVSIVVAVPLNDALSETLMVRSFVIVLKTVVNKSTVLKLVPVTMPPLELSQTVLVVVSVSVSVKFSDAVMYSVILLGTVKVEAACVIVTVKVVAGNVIIDVLHFAPPPLPPTFIVLFLISALEEVGVIGLPVTIAVRGDDGKVFVDAFLHCPLEHKDEFNCETEGDSEGERNAVEPCSGTVDKRATEVASEKDDNPDNWLNVLLSVLECVLKQPQSEVMVMTVVE